MTQEAEVALGLSEARWCEWAAMKRDELLPDEVGRVSPSHHENHELLHLRHLPHSPRHILINTINTRRASPETSLCLWNALPTARAAARRN